MALPLIAAAGGALQGGMGLAKSFRDRKRAKRDFKREKGRARELERLAGIQGRSSVADRGLQGDLANQQAQKPVTPISQGISDMKRNYSRGMKDSLMGMAGQVGGMAANVAGGLASMGGGGAEPQMFGQSPEMLPGGGMGMNPQMMQNFALQRYLQQLYGG